MSKHQYLFLLGGPDLEMQTIQHLLDQQGIPCVDAGLGWGNARIEAYEGERFQNEIDKALKAGATIVGIEIQGTPKAWPNYLLIDHHNENEDKPSSLEQVAERLGLKLDRRQRLIAANDRGYIPALRSMGATEVEIHSIRKEDRMAQGITEPDEALGKESVSKRLTKYADLSVVDSQTDRFATITDRLPDCKNLLIYTEDELTYYGIYKTCLAKHFQDLLDTGKAYKGGTSSGFFGIGKGAVDKDKLNELKETIIKIAGEPQYDRIHSYHIFMFPFKWEHAQHAQERDSFPEMAQRFNINKFEAAIGLEQPGCQWVENELELNQHTYNEYNYFYPYVREVLYDLGEDLSPKGVAPTDGVEVSHKDELIRHLEYKLPESEKLYYCIQLPEKPVYYLQIDSILLNIYATGTGVLSFHLRNFSHAKAEDVLRINQFGRRLFPPFFSLDDQSVSTGEPRANCASTLLSHTKGSELPAAIWLGEKQSTASDALQNSFEDFTSYEKPSHIEHGAFHLPAFITALFPEKFFVSQQRAIDLSYHKIYLRPVLDDRMFVVCWYGNKDKPETLKELTEHRQSGSAEYAYEADDWWYKYMFLDADWPMCQNKIMLKEFNQKHTYARWVDQRTLFGITRYSLVMLTTPLPSPANDYEGVPTYLVRHLQTIYTKMAELCLIQRATMLSFSDEVTHISEFVKKRKQGGTDSTHKDRFSNPEEALRKIQDLYGRYILFVNKIYFREVTAQEQGIEMYNMLQQHMGLKEDIKGLDEEIEELQNYARLEADRYQIKKQDSSNRLLKNLAILSAVFLPFGFILSVLDMNTVKDSIRFEWAPYGPFWYRFIAILIGGIVITAILDRSMGLHLYTSIKNCFRRGSKKDKKQ